MLLRNFSCIFCYVINASGVKFCNSYNVLNMKLVPEWKTISMLNCSDTAEKCFWTRGFGEYRNLLFKSSQWEKLSCFMSNESDLLWRIWFRRRQWQENKAYLQHYSRMAFSVETYSWENPIALHSDMAPSSSRQDIVAWNEICKCEA